MTINLFPFSPKLNQKWWHRLSKVLIFIITFIFFLISIFLIIISINESKIQRAIYNFETGYLDDKHSEEELNKWNATYDFVDRFIAASQDPTSSGREITPKKAVTLDELKNGLNADYEFQVRDSLLGAIERGNLNNEYKIKIWHEYSLFPEVLWILLGLITYLILIGSYGVVLYIAYGSNPFQLTKHKNK